MQELVRAVSFESVKVALGNPDLAIRLAFDGTDGGDVFVRPRTLTDISIGPLTMQTGYNPHVRQFSFEATDSEGTFYVVTVALWPVTELGAYVDIISSVPAPPRSATRRH